MKETHTYRYALPQELIAQKPREPRDSARLFVYDCASDTVTLDIFRNISSYFPPRSLLVLNDTKVVPARITLYKETGGKVVALFLVNEYNGGSTVRALLDRVVLLGDVLYLKKGDPMHRFSVVAQEENVFVLKPGFDMKLLPELLQKYGTTPIPPYLKGVTLHEKALRSRYQTIFAENEASVAAPTASLHFTQEVFEALEKKHIERAFVTLHVGMGTFAPIHVENFKLKKLHKEEYEISQTSARTIAEAKEEGRAVVAVGTTAMRTLESVASELLANAYGRRHLPKGATDLFIFPPYDFRVADALITNFHVPESSLMCLVDAFLQHKKARRSILDLYKIAIAEKFRFFSFGDAMLIF